VISHVIIRSKCQVVACQVSGDNRHEGDIRQVTRDSIVYVSTSSESMSNNTENSTDIRDQYEYRKIMQFQEKQ